MTIAAFIADGFGSYGDVAHIITMGLDIGDIQPPVVTQPVATPGFIRNHTTTWTYHRRHKGGLTAFEKKQEQAVEKVVRQAKKALAAHPKVTATLAGKTVEQWEREAIASAKKSVSAQATPKTRRDTLTEQTIFYEFIKRGIRQKVNHAAQAAKKAKEEKRHLRDEEDIILMLLH